MAKKITIFDSFGEYDLQKESVVNGLLEKIDIEGNNDVELDIVFCMIGYQSTTTLIDKLLTDLSKLEGSKKLNVVTNLDLGNKKFYACFFYKSKFIGTEDHDINVNKEIVSKKLEENDITFLVSIVSGNDKTKLKRELKVWPRT
jgi:hypothetical protein